MFGFDPFQEFGRWPARMTERTAMPADPASIELTVDGDVVTVHAERTWAPAEGEAVVAAERPRGSFTRRFRLGEQLDGSRLTASSEHGVLTLTIPVVEASLPRRIPVNVGAAPEAVTPEAVTPEAVTPEAGQEPQAA